MTDKTITLSDEFLQIPKMDEQTLARFWQKVAIAGEDDCWLWLSAICSTRVHYGQFSIGNVRYRAHRISYLLANGRMPANKLLMHTCDNGLCVNPKHLVPGTYADNHADMKAKGRSYRPLGEKNIHARLTTKEVLFLRELVQACGGSVASAQRVSGYGRRLIESAILKWPHVPHINYGVGKSLWMRQ